MVRDYPVLGVGYGKRIFKKVYIEENYIDPEAVERIHKPNAHNLFLDISVQLGIPGLLIFLLLIAAFFKETLLAYNRAEDYFSKGCLLGCFLGIYEFLQTGLMGNLFYDENGLYIIFLLATAMVLRRGLSPSKTLTASNLRPASSINTLRDNK
jgi:O-antigen ligase